MTATVFIEDNRPVLFIVSIAGGQYQEKEIHFETLQEIADYVFSNLSGVTKHWNISPDRKAVSHACNYLVPSRASFRSP